MLVLETGPGKEFPLIQALAGNGFSNQSAAVAGVPNLLYITVCPLAPLPYPFSVSEISKTPAVPAAELPVIILHNPLFNGLTPDEWYLTEHSSIALPVKAVFVAGTVLSNPTRK